MSNLSFDDPVVAEIHAIRAAMLAECDGSVVELMKRVAIRQQSSAHPTIAEPFRKRTEPSVERVISYTTDYGPLEVYSAEYDEVDTATLRRSRAWMDDSTLDVVLKDGSTLTLWVSPEKDRDKDFHARFTAQLERHRAPQVGVPKH